MNQIDAYDDSTMEILMYVLVFRSMFMVIYLKLLLVILLFGLDFRSENWRLDEGRLLLAYLVDHRPCVFLRDGRCEACKDLLQGEAAPWVQAAARPPPRLHRRPAQHLPRA